MLTPDLLARLACVDTPTVCNAIEVVQGGRGFGGFTRGTPFASDPGARAIVGHAATLRIRGAHPPTDDPAVVRARRMAAYRHMFDAPRPGVVVVEDMDWPDCVGAYWGEVNTWVHKAFGMAGVLTNGIVRDLGDLAPGFPVLAGSVGPSHGFVHVVDFAAPVTVFGLRVADGDVIHADRHGAVVIPPAVLPGLAAGLDRLAASEALVIGPAKAGLADFDSFERAWTAFERART